MMRFRSYGVASAAIALSFSPPAYGQGTGDESQIGDIIVTAQKREQNLQQVPMAITALQTGDLQARGISGVEDLSRALPGLQIGQSGGTVQPFLRGVGNSSTTVGNEASVALYVDGVYYSRLPVGFFSLGNVERVEVLKGPQGTLFGRNASGGVIQIVTPNPSYDPKATGSLSYGRFNLVEGNIYVTRGLTDRVALDLSLNGRRQGSGFGTNVTTGRRTNYLDYLTARSKLMFEPSDNTRFILTGLYSYSKMGREGNSLPGTIRGHLTPPFDPLLPQDWFDQDNDQDGFLKAQSRGVTLHARQELSFATLSSITGYIKTISSAGTDADNGPRPDQVALLHAPVKQFTQEAQLSSPHGSSWDWVLGLYYYNTKSGYDDETFFYSPNGSQAAVLRNEGFHPIGFQRAKSYAVFAQAAHEILPRLQLTGGLRYSWDRNRADGRIVRGNGNILSDAPAARDSLNKLTYKAALDYQLSRDALVYGSASRGFKSAVFNTLTYNPIPNKPEVVDAYEVGFKSTLFDRRLRLNAAAYYYKLKNPQVQLTVGTTVLFSNADASRVKGLELEAEARIMRGLTLRTSLNRMSSRYTRYGFIDPVTGACVRCAPSGPQNLNPPFGAASPLKGVVAGGNYTPQAPKLTGNIGVDYEFDSNSGKWLLTADYFYNDGYFTEPDNLIRQRSFEVVNAQVRYSPDDVFAFRLWGKNLTGSRYLLRASTQSGAAGYPYLPAPPLTYGVAVDIRL